MVHIDLSHDLLKENRHAKMMRVIIESRFSADNVRDLVRNQKFTLGCMRDCFIRGEAPYASHVIYAQTHILDDFVASERAMGMHAGFIWGDLGEKTVVYEDLGISKGMEMGIRHAEMIGRKVEYRKLGFVPSVSEEEVLLEEKRLILQRNLLEELKLMVHPDEKICLTAIGGF